MCVCVCVCVYVCVCVRARANDILSFSLLLSSLNDLRDLPGLVISADEGDSVWIPDLQGQEQQERLHRVEAAIHKVPHEQVVCVWHVSPDLQESERAGA